MNSIAWLIHKTYAGDSSVRALFWTREYGMIRALYKGGRQPKKQALLREFTPLWVAFHEKKGWFYVRHLEMAAVSLNLQDRYLFSGLYLNELLYLTLPLQDAYPELYDIYVHSLQRLYQASSTHTLEQVLRRFEWALLVSLGYAISFTHEAHTQLPIVATNYYAFKAGKGLIRAEIGILGADILALANNELDNAQVLKIAKYLMREAIAHVLAGKEIKTRALFEKISKSADTLS
ncbi:MAG TPA: DNA repair protein RecO [Legionellaceae bacterium]|nr:DNA repair protein RecO [Legionellaceae bacterium]